MDAMLLRLYETQVAFQCLAALDARRRMTTALQEHESEQFWFAVEGFLSAVANISKVCWGLRGKKEVERQPIRDSLGIDDSSALRPTTDMRNHFEHFDQRLEDWEAKSSAHIFIDFNLGSIQTPDRIDVFRNYDPTTEKLVFWGDEYDVLKIVKALEILLPRALEQRAKPHWIA